MKSLRIHKVLIFLISVKTALLALACFYPFTGPHTIRQADTMGISYRYFQKFFNEPFEWISFLPSVLNSGDTSGILPTEFPILNILSSPFFLFNENYGEGLARLFLLLVHFLITILIYLKVKELNYSYKTSLATAVLLLPLASFSAVQYGKFMPDYLAFILAVYCVVLNLDEKKNPYYLFVIGTLALLIKPPVVLVFSFVLLKPFKSILKDLFWVLPSIIFCVVFYKVYPNYIISISDFNRSFYLGSGLSLESFLLFFTNIDLQLRIWSKYNLFWGGFIIVSIYILSQRMYFTLKVYCTILLQLIFIALLAGRAIHFHNYYLIGMSLSFCLLLGFVLHKDNMGKTSVILLLSLFVFVGESLSIELRSIYDSEKNLSWRIPEQCMELKERNNDFPWGKGQIFRTNITDHPLLELCFKERGLSKKSNWAFYLKQEVPVDCTKVDATQDLMLLKCH